MADRIIGSVLIVGGGIGGIQAALVRAVEQDQNITCYLGAELSAVDGFVGSFTSTLVKGPEKVSLHHGVAVLATGARELQPQEYLYGQDPRVITGLELDRRFLDQDESLKNLTSVVFVQCVGSREPERPYCSRICCTHSVTSALHLKELNPHLDV